MHTGPVVKTVTHSAFGDVTGNTSLETSGTNAYFVKKNNVCFILLIIYFTNTADAYLDGCRGKQI